MIYLLDTNAWIEVLNRPQGKVAMRLAMHSPQEILHNSVSHGELAVGVFKSTNPQFKLASTKQVIQQFVCLDYDMACAEEYGKIKAQLERIGLPIGFHDTQIAAIALCHGLIVVTHNVRDFQRVPGLVIEDWQVP